MEAKQKGGDIMSKKTYDVVVRKKAKGDFDTIYAQKVEGTLADSYVTIYGETKDGRKFRRELASDAIEEIEREEGWNEEKNADDNSDKA